MCYNFELLLTFVLVEVKMKIIGFKFIHFMYMHILLISNCTLFKILVTIDSI